MYLNHIYDNLGYNFEFLPKPHKTGSYNVHNYIIILDRSDVVQK